MTGNPVMQSGRDHGVGGRQEQHHPPEGGGGYLDKCTEPEAPLGTKKNRDDPRLSDPRFAALLKIGMHPRWVNIAEKIGMDHFLVLWRALDSDATLSGGSILLSMPRLSRFMRHQRNAMVLALYQGGRSAKEIQRKIRVDLCESLTVRHIDRLTSCSRRKVK
jgi:hypothetical protein